MIRFLLLFLLAFAARGLAQGVPSSVADALRTNAAAHRAAILANPGALPPARVSGNFLAPTSGVTKVVFEGDSLSSGTAWVDRLFSAFPGALKVNAANAGDSAANMAATFPAQIAPHAPTAGQTSWMVLLAGVNDLYTYGASTVYGSLKSLWAQGRARGFKVCAVTLLDSRFLSGFDPPSQRLELAKLNFLIRQDPTLYDALLPADKWFADATNTTYFNSDQLHLNNASSALFGTLAASHFLAGKVNATALAPEMIPAMVWQDDLKRLAAEYANTFQPMDFDRFTQISTGSGTAFTPAYYGDYLITVAGTAGNSGGIMGRYPTNTSADNIQWNPSMSRGIMLHARRYFGVQAAGIVRVLVGPSSVDISGPLARTGFGFECQDSTDTHLIRAVAHNGGALTNGAWVPRYSANGQWFAVCTNGTVSLWERFNIGADWSNWALLQTIGGGPAAQNGTGSQMVRINAEVGASPSEDTMSIDLIQAIITIGLDRPSDLWAR